MVAEVLLLGPGREGKNDMLTRCLQQFPLCHASVRRPIVNLLAAPLLELRIRLLVVRRILGVVHIQNPRDKPGVSAAGHLQHGAHQGVVPSRRVVILCLAIPQILIFDVLPQEVLRRPEMRENKMPFADVVEPGQGARGCASPPPRVDNKAAPCDPYVVIFIHAVEMIEHGFITEPVVPVEQNDDILVVRTDAVHPENDVGQGEPPVRVSHQCYPVFLACQFHESLVRSVVGAIIDDDGLPVMIRLGSDPLYKPVHPRPRVMDGTDDFEVLRHVGVSRPFHHVAGSRGRRANPSPIRRAS